MILFYVGLGMMIVFASILLTGCLVHQNAEDKAKEDIEQMNYLKEWTKKHSK